MFSPTTALAASVTLRWQANQEPDISSYNLYYGTQSRNYGLPIPVGNETSYTVDNLTAGTAYYFALTAVDTAGNESGYSAEVVANATTSEPATEDSQLLPSTNNGLQSVVLVTSVSSPQPEGRMIQLMAQVNGTELAFYQYQFEIKKQGKSWKILRKYSTEASTMWETSGKKGKWNIRVKVRHRNNPSIVLGVDKIKKFKIKR